MLEFDPIGLRIPIVRHITYSHYGDRIGNFLAATAESFFWHKSSFGFSYCFPVLPFGLAVAQRLVLFFPTHLIFGFLAQMSSSSGKRGWPPNDSQPLIFDFGDYVASPISVSRSGVQRPRVPVPPPELPPPPPLWPPDPAFPVPCPPDPPLLITPPLFVCFVQIFGVAIRLRRCTKFGATRVQYLYW